MADFNYAIASSEYFNSSQYNNIRLKNKEVRIYSNRIFTFLVGNDLIMGVAIIRFLSSSSFCSSL